MRVRWCPVGTNGSWWISEVRLERAAKRPGGIRISSAGVNPFHGTRAKVLARRTG
jgi:hypothetical protein